MIRETNHLTFTQTHDTGKTKVFCIQNKAGVELGEVRWSSAWRRYCFFVSTRAPNVFNCYDAECLGDIVTFINILMAERKKAK